MLEPLTYVYVRTELAVLPMALPLIGSTDWVVVEESDVPEAEAEAEDALAALADLAALRAAEASVLACEERGKQRTAHEDKKAWKYVQTHV